MASTTKRKKKEDDFQIVFKNDLSPELWRQFQEGVISANLKEQVPAHLQEQLVDKFVEAGLMVP